MGCTTGAGGNVEGVCAPGEGSLLRAAADGLLQELDELAWERAEVHKDGLLNLKSAGSAHHTVHTAKFSEVPP